jgi:hypothetical protein
MANTHFINIRIFLDAYGFPNLGLEEQSLEGACPRFFLESSALVAVLAEPTNTIPSQPQEDT